MATAALVAWEWLQREEHVFGAFEIVHYRRKERPNSVEIVHPKNGEEASWPLFDETGEPLFPELMTELDEVKKTMVSGLVFRRDHAHRRASTPLPWITERKDLRYLRSVVKDIIVEAGIRNELSFTSSATGAARRGLIAISPTPSCALRAVIDRRDSCREERTKAANLSE